MSVLETLDGAAAPRPWTDLLRPMFPGAPPELIEQTLLMSLRELFRDAEAWVEVTPYVQLVAGQTRYVVPTPIPQTEVDRVYQGETETGWQIFPVDRIRGFELADHTFSGLANGFVGIQPGVIDLLRPPSVSGDRIRFRVSLVPSSFAVPDWTMRLYQDGVVALASSRLYAVPLKPWTSIEASVVQKREYEVLVRRYRVRARQGFNASEVRWPFPRIAG